MPTKHDYRYLNISFWNNDSNCKYMCMRYVVAERNKYYLPLLQYWGKWPFPCSLFIEEPASFLFSLINLIENVVGWLHYRRHLDCRRTSTMWHAHSFLSKLQVGCARVFHNRDIYWTEKLDYFSAALIIGSLHDVRTNCYDVLLTVILTYHI